LIFVSVPCPRITGIWCGTTIYLKSSAPSSRLAAVLWRKRHKQSKMAFLCRFSQTAT
jgi:hypothetical protein